MALRPVASDGPPAVEIRGLVKRLGGRAVLDGLDLSVAAGECVAVVGPHGSGKSTLLRILVDLLRPTSGTASVLGVSSRRGARRRASLGYLPASPRHPPVGSVRSALSYAAHLNGARSAPYRALSRRLGLDPRARLRWLDPNASQKLAVAQALGHGPSLVLLDEPITDLEAADVTELITILRELTADGAALLIAAHQLDPFADLVDRVVLLRHGVITHEGSVRAMRRSLPITATVVFDDAPPVDELAAIDPHLDVDGRRVTLTVGRDSARLLTLLAGSSLESVEMASAGVSDALLEQYGEDEPLPSRGVIGDGP